MIMLKSEIVKCLDVVRGTAGKQDSILSNFMFFGNVVVTYNEKWMTSTKLPEGVDIYGAVHAEEFYSTVKMLRNEEIKYEVLDDRIEVRCGGSRLKVSLTKGDTLSNFRNRLLPKLEWKHLDPTFSDKLNGIHIKYSKGLYLNKNFMCESVPTEMHYGILSDTEFDEVMIDIKCTEQLMKFNPVEHSMVRGMIFFRNDCGDILGLRYSEPDPQTHSELMGVAEYMKNTDNTVHIKFSEDTEGAVERAINYSTSSGNKLASQVIKFSIGNGDMTVSSRRIHGSFDETLSLDEFSDSCEMSFYISDSGARHIFSISDEVFIENINSNFRVKYFSEDTYHIICTLNIREVE